MNCVNKRIGIIGGGQLGKMMILEAKRLGFYVTTLDPSEKCPSHSISDELIVADFYDEKALRALADKSDVITYEIEHIGVGVLCALEREGHVIYPSVRSLSVIQDKYTQKSALRDSGVPVPDFEKVQSTGDILNCGKRLGFPLMLKTTTGGYDGKGNALIRDEAGIEEAFQSLGGGEKELMAEKFVDFKMEISIIACRGTDGAKVVYPAAENIHKNSILDTTIVPADISAETACKASRTAEKVMEVFDGVGAFCVEMFVTGAGEIYINEVAPRPHNSGHYTIEGCFINQFENHIRGVVGLPLGNAELKQPAVMINLLGQSDGIPEIVGLEETCLDPNIRVHLYGKEESKKGRKMGHFTVIDKTVRGAIERAERAKAVLKIIGKALL